MNSLKIIQSVLVVTALLIMAGCENFLAEEPLDQRVEENFYKTEQDAQEALVAIYDVLQWNTVIGYHVPEMLSDIASDDAYAGGASRNDAPNIIEVDQHNIRTTNGEVHGLWKKYYTGIYRANKYLQQIENIEAGDAFKSRTIAEAKFLRAYFYFDLVRFFENVPLITTPLDNPDEYSQPQAEPVAVYNQIGKDLMEAIPDLPESVATNQQGRITKWAGEALLGRVYLFYNGVYGQDLPAGDQTVDRTVALQMLEDVINNSGHGLMTDYSNLFTPESEFSVESVFEITYSDSRPWWDWGYIQGGEGYIAAQMQGPRVTQPTEENYQRGWSFSTVTQELINAFDPADPRLEATVLFEDELNGGLTIGYQHTGNFTQKYTTHKAYTPSEGQLELNWGNNYRAIRYADVLLMAAELHVKDGNPESARPYLDAVRNRVEMPTVEPTLDNIYQERRLELALEGQRYWDLLRRGQDVAESYINVPAGTKANYVGDDLDFKVQYDASTKGFLPIPQSEIDISNGNLIQNDGY
ncbi:RagB/SusD family nutrient uptake outer membrane protein [Balneolaceae bacterium YR4-1]|uniref:RagB/SusD family nutrient uptake outer membrane protein n=1 Tax=Halalkalibaculum roseum TaxID=2709311 RepID=A0A6M1SRF4_9BACT|nr:RagB/SusD family nutrient uptake outer membrane protein [Halalkalibaculum roseum]NGP75322.1 RagB/SusD family nutrient uptake outer membrane protein [Halalkalibaculum roseum]